MNFSRKLRSKFQSRLGHVKPDKDVPSPPETFRSKPSNIATTPHFMEPLKNQTPIGATVGHGLKNVLEIATEAADAFGPLKSTLSGLRAILKAFEVSFILWSQLLLNRILAIFGKQGEA